MALLRHRRFRSLCLAYLFASFAFDVPFVHLVRFALDSGMKKTVAQVGWLLVLWLSLRKAESIVGGEVQHL
jgi:hypothetical protein